MKTKNLKTMKSRKTFKMSRSRKFRLKKRKIVRRIFRCSAPSQGRRKGGKRTGPLARLRSLTDRSPKVKG